MPWMSQAAYARIRGVSPRRIGQYIQAGKIPTNALKIEGKRRQVHSERADKALDQNIDIAKRRKKGNGQETKERKEEVIRSVDFDKITYHEAQTQEKRYKAALAKLEYEQKIAELVKIKQVQKEAFEIARKVRDGILNIPGRIAGILAAESDAFVIEQILIKEFKQILEELSNVKISF